MRAVTSIGLLLLILVTAEAVPSLFRYPVPTRHADQPHSASRETGLVSPRTREVAPSVSTYTSRRDSVYGPSSAVHRNPITNIRGIRRDPAPPSRPSRPATYDSSRTRQYEQQPFQVLQRETTPHSPDLYPAPAPPTRATYEASNEQSYTQPSRNKDVYNIPPFYEGPLPGVYNDAVAFSKQQQIPYQAERPPATSRYTRPQETYARPVQQQREPSENRGVYIQYSSPSRGQVEYENSYQRPTQRYQPREAPPAYAGPPPRQEFNARQQESQPQATTEHPLLAGIDFLSFGDPNAPGNEGILGREKIVYNEPVRYQQLPAKEITYSFPPRTPRYGGNGQQVQQAPGRVGLPLTQRYEAPPHADRQNVRYEAPPHADRQNVRYEAPPHADRQNVRYEAPPHADRQNVRYGAPPPADRQNVRYEAPPPADSQNVRYEEPPPADRQNVRYEAPPPTDRQNVRYEAPPAPTSQPRPYKLRLDNGRIDTDDSLSYTQRPTHNKPIRSPLEFSLPAIKILPPDFKHPSLSGFEFPGFPGFGLNPPEKATEYKQPDVNSEESYGQPKPQDEYNRNTPPVRAVKDPRDSAPAYRQPPPRQPEHQQPTSKQSYELPPLFRELTAEYEKQLAAKSERPPDAPPSDRQIYAEPPKYVEQRPVQYEKLPPTYNQQHETPPYPNVRDARVPEYPSQSPDVPTTYSSQSYQGPSPTSSQSYDRQPAYAKQDYQGSPTSTGQLYDSPPALTGQVYIGPHTSIDQIYARPRTFSSKTYSGQNYDSASSNPGAQYERPPPSDRAYESPPVRTVQAENSRRDYEQQAPPRPTYERPPSNAGQSYEVPTFPRESYKRAPQPLRQTYEEGPPPSAKYERPAPRQIYQQHPHLSTRKRYEVSAPKAPSQIYGAPAQLIVEEEAESNVQPQALPRPTTYSQNPEGIAPILSPYESVRPFSQRPAPAVSDPSAEHQPRLPYIAPPRYDPAVRRDEPSARVAPPPSPTHLISNTQKSSAASTPDRKDTVTVETSDPSSKNLRGPYFNDTPRGYFGNSAPSNPFFQAFPGYKYAVDAFKTDDSTAKIE
ncbi:PREDICTED: extensin-like isoform X2 [Priapulus caudatus]|uniref:Extensin-like isoform X2 n=1 Tax=Priapulus caudatus TaxID=37621 RepID=A0ABM1E2K2_PRICU|nr:PREDICTED: extensin-like isoform X2 [Priapulus caudatus]